MQTSTMGWGEGGGCFSHLISLLLWDFQKGFWAGLLRFLHECTCQQYFHWRQFIALKWYYKLFQFGICHVKMTKIRYFWIKKCIKVTIRWQLTNITTSGICGQTQWTMKPLCKCLPKKPLLSRSLAVEHVKSGKLHSLTCARWLQTQLKFCHNIHMYEYIQ